MSDFVSNTYVSAHDPLCPYSGEFITLSMSTSCQCDLITEVREDMLRRCEEAAYTDLSTLEDDMREAFGKGSDAARIVAGYRTAMPSFQELHKERP